MITYIMKTKLLLIVLFVHTLNVFPKDSRLYSSGDLTCNLIKNICQDSRGFIWVATEYGLNKFDGMHFTQYLHNKKDSTSLLGNYVHTLTIDKEQTLWVGCSNGLQYYLPAEDAFQTIHFENNLEPHVTGIIELSTGEMLITTSGRGIFTINKRKKTATLAKEISYACENYLLTCVFRDKKNQLWIGSEKNGVVRLNLETGISTKYNTPAISNSKVTDILEDKTGKIYISTTSSIEIFNEKTNQFFQLKNVGSEKLVISDLATNKKGDILVGTDGQGLKYINRVTNTLLNVENIHSAFNFDRAKVHAILEDRDQNLWLGCFYGGVLVFPNEPKRFNFWSFADQGNKISGTVTAISKDSEGYIWCCVDNDGVFKFDRNGKVVASFPQPKAGATIFEDSKNSLWIGTYDKGIGKINKQTGEVNYLAEFAGKQAKFVTGDQQGNLYISTFGTGFCRYNTSTGSIQRFEASTSASTKGLLSNNWISTMFLDSEGLLWLGHYKGIDCFNTRTNRFLSFKFSDIMSKTICFSLLEDHKGNICFGTNTGLYVYNKKKQSIKHYTIESGLSNNVISGLEEDEKGDIWCSTFNGINHLNLYNNQIIKYYSDNGRSNNGYTCGAYFKDKDGLIYFGGNNGITSFKPKDIIQRSYDRRVIITNLYLHDQTVNTTTLSNGKKVIDTPLTESTEFRLAYSDNTFTFEFSTMDFADQENISYEYTLDDSSDTWHSTLPGDNRITYNNLAPGNYHLKVRASKNGSYSPVSIYEINISPPWYRTFIAYLLYILILCALGVMGFTIRRRKQEDKINEAKFQFFINISHEIRSPMTLIISPLEKLLKETHDEKTTKALQTMQRNANRVLGLINQLLDVRKFDKGQMQIKCSETNMVEFIDEVFRVFEYQANSRNIKLIFKHTMEQLPVWIDKNNFDKILINLLSNSFKYTPDSGEIIITLTSGSEENISGLKYNYAEIRVEDSGIGLEKDKLNKIFDRFYQIGNDMTFASIGTGIGLNLCQILVELHHGTITATNRTETPGSCFTIRIPLGNDHLHKEEQSDGQASLRPTLQALTSSQTVLPNKKGLKSKTNYKILIVDDEDEIVEFLRLELEEDYKIITCTNGIEALGLIHTNSPDLIISDVMMPKMNGIELLNRIKSNSNINHIPVILLTSKMEHEDRMKGLEKGADAYLSKPFNTDELEILVKNLITSRKYLKGKYSGAQDQEDKIKTVELKSSDDVLMDRIMNFVNENMDNADMSVEMLAQHVGLGRVQLHRKLKEITGLPTAEFIRNLRLKQAAILLKEKKNNITQIAYAVGFTNQTHFSATFKKFYGVTPSEYIQQFD